MIITCSEKLTDFTVSLPFGFTKEHYYDGNMVGKIIYDYLLVNS